jgi:hypothetical protein
MAPKPQPPAGRPPPEPPAVAPGRDGLQGPPAQARHAHAQPACSERCQWEPAGRCGGPGARGPPTNAPGAEHLTCSRLSTAIRLLPTPPPLRLTTVVSTAVRIRSVGLLPTNAIGRLRRPRRVADRRLLPCGVEPRRRRSGPPVAAEPPSTRAPHRQHRLATARRPRRPAAPAASTAIAKGPPLPPLAPRPLARHTGDGELHGGRRARARLRRVLRRCAPTLPRRRGSSAADCCARLARSAA